MERMTNSPGSRPGQNAPSAPPRRKSLVRILLADDHQIVRQGLAGLLERETDMEVVGEASNGMEAFELVKRLQPDVVLMDVSMLHMGGVEATRMIHEEWPNVHVVGLSMHHREDVAAAMLEAGATDYLDKDGPIDRLLAVIRREPAGGR
jgi:DNA-binding NarL/FixJ family response regulator